MRVLLDVQSHFSLFRGTASPETLLRAAAEQGYTHIAIADHAGLYGLPEVLRFAPRCGVTPLYGASFRTGPRSGLTLLVAEAEGYARLCGVITRWHAAEAERRPAAERLRAALAAGVGGLVALCDDADLVEWLRPRTERLWYRVGRSLRRPPRRVREAGLPCAFAPEVVMLAPADHATHRLLCAIGRKTTFDRIGPEDCAPETAWLRTPAAYAEAYAVFADAMRESERIAASIRFVPATAPIAPPPPAGTEDALALLRRRAYDGAQHRYGEIGDAVAARLEFELDLIGTKGFAEYFLLVDDIVAVSPRTCGRGSGAASLVNYCLGVTNVDPLKYNLMFERFLNAARTDPPDIDVDFAWDERDGVIRHVLATHGADRVARVCNHNRFRPRLAIREAARAFGFAEDEISRRMQAMPQTISAYATRPDLETATRAGASPDGDPWDEAMRLAATLVGLPRGVSMHCGGVVVTPGPVAAHAPVERSAGGQSLLQWEKDGAEAMGLIKVDLLGNRSLAVIRDTVRDVAAASGIDEAAVIPGDPADDAATRATVAAGATMGCFYIESPAMRLLLQKARRGDFDHLVIHSSIIRPAANDFIREYLARLHGKPWQPFHPRLAGVFDETYGIPVYQEDVVKLAIALAGFDYARADGLRKCLGKADAGRRLQERFDAYRRGCRAQGVDEETIRTTWATVLSMTGYSFCKPHSASYARVSFEAAYLKTHHPAAFLAAVLSNGGGYYSAQAYVSECQRMGLRVLGPDVNASRETCSPEDGAVRIGLGGIAGLTERAVAAIREAHRRDGPFASLAGFVDRTRLATEDLRRLALVGALDALAPGLNRPQILWLVQARRGRPPGGGLFAPAPECVPRLPPYTLRQRYEAEYAALGFLPGAHPLILYEEGLGRLRRRTVPIARMDAHVGRRGTVLGWPVTAKVVETRRGEPMVFYSFEDFDAITETALFPEAYRRYHRTLRHAQPFLLTGRVEAEFGVATLIVQRMEPVVGCERASRTAAHALPRSRRRSA